MQRTGFFLAFAALAVAAPADTTVKGLTCANVRCAAPNVCVEDPTPRCVPKGPFCGGHAGGCRDPAQTCVPYAHLPACAGTVDPDDPICATGICVPKRSDEAVSTAPPAPGPPRVPCPQQNLCFPNEMCYLTDDGHVCEPRALSKRDVPTPTPKPKPRPVTCAQIFCLRGQCIDTPAGPVCEPDDIAKRNGGLSKRSEATPPHHIECSGDGDECPEGLECQLKEPWARVCVPKPVPTHLPF